ncbi:hypothetical protein [Streptacidiphilus anmyonensis]|uniref:hypothetical protein n=1 Tax=Streptacidiphilus anmyonensis TaxID=405782 RepID=UPI0005A86AAF
MARWEPDAQGRLQQAAMELFAERGYSEVTDAYEVLVDDLSRQVKAGLSADVSVLYPQLAG